MKSIENCSVAQLRQQEPKIGEDYFKLVERNFGGDLNTLLFNLMLI